MGLILDLVFGRKLEVIMFVVSDLAVLCGSVKALGNGRFFGDGFRGPVEFGGSGEVQRYGHALRCSQEKYEVVAPYSAV